MVKKQGNGNAQFVVKIVEVSVLIVNKFGLLLSIRKNIRNWGKKLPSRLCSIGMDILILGLRIVWMRSRRGKVILPKNNRQKKKKLSRREKQRKQNNLRNNQMNIIKEQVLRILKEICRIRMGRRMGNKMELKMDKEGR